jgi:hypothetical protein
MAIKLFKRKAKATKNISFEEDYEDINSKQKAVNVGRSTSTEDTETTDPVSDETDKEGNITYQEHTTGGEKDPSVSEEDMEETDAVEIISSKTAGKCKASLVRSMKNDGYKSTRSVTVPTARDSAYTGPPRYDWIDVESAAAVKVQAVFRRNQVLNQLEREGKTTAAIRNRMRSRHAGKKAMASEDVPAIFRFCGMGFLFGDATGEDTDALNQKKEDKRALKYAQEDLKRKFRMRKKSEVELEEAVEVVDNLDN